MSDHAATARANALHCEAKKHAYRQTQDGVVVSFVLHPQEVPEGLATAALGTRYVLALVEVNGDETPATQSKGGDAAEPKHHTPDTTPRLVSAQPSGAKESKVWRELTYAQQAGIRCSEEAFRKFLHEKIAPDADFDSCTTIAATELAASIVRTHCIVNSRKDIRPNHPSARLWRELDEAFQVWMHHPEFA
jgi:hypothetical protein